MTASRRKKVRAPVADKAIKAPDENKQADQIDQEQSTRASREVIRINSIAGVRQLHGGAIVSVDGTEKTVVGKKVSILIEG